MLFKSASLLALVFVFSVAALGTDFTPAGPSEDLEKRQLLSGVLCGIGLLGACVNTQTDVRNCESPFSRLGGKTSIQSNPGGGDLRAEGGPNLGLGC